MGQQDLNNLIREFARKEVGEAYPEYPVRSGSALEQMELDGPTSIRLGTVQYIDIELMQARISFSGSQGGSAIVSSFLTGDSSKSSDVGSLPSVGSLVLLGLVRKLNSVEEWAMLGTLKSGYRGGQGLVATQSRPQEPSESSRERQLSRKIDNSEYQISAESGGEALLDEGWGLLASDLSEVKTDLITETLVSNLHNTFTQTFAGRTHQGAAIRMIPFDKNLKDQPGLYQHPSGLTYQYVTPDGTDPAERYISGKSPGLVATEEVHIYHELTDLIPDLTPYLHGQMPIHNNNLNEISTRDNSHTVWHNMSSDRPPDTQPITQPKQDSDREKNNQNQTLYQQDASSIQARRDLRYTHDSNLIGIFETDPVRYLSVLTAQALDDKYSTDLAHDHSTFPSAHPHSDFRLRVPVRSEYSPLPYNKTAYYQSKEGYQTWILGATLSQENLPLTGASIHDKGAGRSGEIVSLGGIDVVLGKTQDEEESLSLTTIGQIFAHIGADSGNNPHDRRSMQSLNHATGKLEDLDLYNFTPLPLGDAVDYANKQGAENLSAVIATDGGISARFGIRDEGVVRKFVKNGTTDGPGRDSGGPDAHDAKRSIYGSGDSVYSFHDLSEITMDNTSEDPCDLAGDSYAGYDPDIHGRSWDFHLCSDMFLRIGKNPDSGVSWSMDTDGGLLWWLGKDDKGRSLVLEADGGAQIKINPSENGDALNLYINGNVYERIDGSVQRTITGDLTETIEGSRTINIAGNDTLMVSGDYTPVFHNFTMMCTGMGTVGFAMGLDTQVIGITNVDLIGPVTTNIVGMNINSVIGNVSNSTMGNLGETVIGNTSQTYIGNKSASVFGKFDLMTSGVASWTAIGPLNITSTAALHLTASTAQFLATGGPLAMGGLPLSLSGVSSISGSGPVSISSYAPISIQSPRTSIM